MARIAILTCSNCTQETNCASIVCLHDIRKRKGFFERYPVEQPVDLVGIISCAGCPTLAAPEKILRRVRAVAEFRLDTLHFSYCMTALCPFISRYQSIIEKEFPALEIIMGTHAPVDKKQFGEHVRELLCPTVFQVQTMNDIIKGRIQLPQG